MKDTLLLEFDYRVVPSSPRYVASQLNAEKGPVGTSAYKIEIQAAPISEEKTFFHLRYSYGYNTASGATAQAAPDPFGVPVTSLREVGGPRLREPRRAGAQRQAAGACGAAELLQRPNHPRRPQCRPSARQAARITALRG